MNTNKQQNQGQAPLKQGLKKQVLKPNALQINQKFHEQERIETRMFD